MAQDVRKNIPQDPSAPTRLLELLRLIEEATSKGANAEDAAASWAQVQRLTAELRSHLPALADQERRLAYLAENETRYRLISENASDVIWTQDLDSELTFISPSVERLTGHSVAEVQTRGLSACLAPESEQVLRDALAEELVREQVSTLDPGRNWTVEAQLRRKPSGTVWVEIRSSFLRDPDSTPTGVLAIARDITQRRKLAAKNERLAAELRHAQKLEAVGRLAGGIAHDFNNLLTAMSGYAEMVQDALAPDHPLYADVQEIRAAAERANGLTRQLLAFSRKQKLDLRPVDLNECIRASQNMLQRIIGEDVQTHLQLADNLWAVESDPGQLDQILANLVVNARDAMPAGGELRIATRAETVDDEAAALHLDAKAGQYCVMTVQDTGCGIDPTLQELVFEPFFSTKPRGTGTGLGLSTVFGIVRQHQGFVTVSSQPGQGARFEIYLPRAHRSSGPDTALRQAAARGGHETVLVVEDEEVVRRLATRMLRDLGYRVHEASDGPQALDLLAQLGSVDLLVTDVVMPRMNGRQLAVALRERCPGARVLYMSGYADETLAALGALDGDVDLLQKPFTADTLATQVRAALDRDS